MVPEDEFRSRGLPVSCRLGIGDGMARMRRWRALSGYGRPTARRRGHRLEVRYQPEPGVGEELEALVAAERQCCSFVTWDVSQDFNGPVLYVTADPGAPDDITSIATLFNAD
jgi:hypothetical protein